MYQEEISRPAFSQRMGVVLERAEKVYLRVLRAVILILATLLLGYAAWLGASSLYKISRSTDAVQEKVAAVAADEITNAEIPVADKRQAPNAKSGPTAAHQAFYSNFVRRYYSLFNSKFEPYRQKEDKKLLRDEFDDSFLNTADRMKAVASGDVNFETDKADLNGLLTVMREAADKPLTRERLERYRTAKKRPVSKKVQRTRTTFRSGWDSYSTACPSWYYEPIGCPVQRTVQTPYTETVTTMEFPKGTQSHTQIFRAFQDRYLTLLQQRREANAAAAENERQRIAADNEEGKQTLMTTLQIFAGFLVLMFFFLLIAIERHQRKLAGRRADGESLAKRELEPEIA